MSGCERRRPVVPRRDMTDKPSTRSGPVVAASIFAYHGLVRRGRRAQSGGRGEPAKRHRLLYEPGCVPDVRLLGIDGPKCKRDRGRATLAPELTGVTRRVV